MVMTTHIKLDNSQFDFIFRLWEEVINSIFEALHFPGLFMIITICIENLWLMFRLLNCYLFIYCLIHLTNFGNLERLLLLEIALKITVSVAVFYIGRESYFSIEKKNEDEPQCSKERVGSENVSLTQNLLS